MLDYACRLLDALLDPVRLVPRDPLVRPEDMPSFER